MPSALKEILISAISLANFVAFTGGTFVFHFFKQMNRKFGPGILLQYLTGKYFNPIEENRIFMFLDLKSSTTIAEKLSHVRYSKLIQDCFAELTDPILENKGQIYQYVGDEVVITWELEKLNSAVRKVSHRFMIVSRSSKDIFE